MIPKVNLNQRVEFQDADAIFKVKSHVAKTNLYYFNRHILPFEDLTPDPHETLCNFVQVWPPGITRKLIWMPRGSFKSSCVAVGYTIFVLVNDLNETVTIFGEERSYSIEILGLIKEQMEGCEPLIELNGGSFRPNIGWKEERITRILGRTDLISKDASINTAGMDSVKAGPHPGLFLLDDPESKKNTRTLALCTDLIDNYKKFSPMMRRPTPKRRGARMVIIGTPWSYQGVYHYILSNPAELRHFAILIGQGSKRSNLLPKIKGKKYISLPKGKEGILLMPKIIPKSFLDDEEDKDPIFASGQYWCAVLSEKGQEFLPEWYRYFLEEDVPKNIIKTIIAVDPAISLKATADYLCILAATQDPLNNFFVRTLIRRRMTPDEVIEQLYQLFFLYRREGPVTIPIESNGFQYLLKWALDKEGKFRGRLPTVAVPHYKVGKTARIRALIKPYKESRIHHLAKNESRDEVSDQQQILESEELTWIADKKSGHDDCPDTLSMVLEVSEPKKGARKRYYSTYYNASDKKTGY